MPCLLVLIAVVLPRFTMFFIWLTTDWFNRAYQSVIWPLLGFWLMPFTTLTYMAAMFNNDHQLTGGWLVLFIFARSWMERDVCLLLLLIEPTLQTG